MNRILSLVVAAATAVVLVSGASAGDVKAGEITVEGPWARASAGPVRNGVAFMTLSNAGTTDDKLIAAASSGVSTKDELHTHIKEGDIMRMRPVDAIDVPAGGVTQLKPGGLHVMLMGLKAPLKEGETFPLTLTFEKSGEVTVDVKVMTAGAMGGGSMQGHGAMQMNKQ
jgi:periplasmic copper chaperone A